MSGGATVVAGFAATAVLSTGSGAAAEPGADPAQVGVFGAPFSEPTIRGRRTDEKCVPKERPAFDRELDCKPAAGSLNAMPGGSVFYWDALEGTENVNNSIAAEYGRVAENDQSRVLEFDGSEPRFSTPAQADGGANPDGEPSAQPLIPGTGTTEPGNDGALFCADQNFLPDGRIMAAGGTAYFNDPGVEGAPVGATELAGVSATRIFDPRTRTWSQAGRMSRGRWYPTLITTGAGKTFVASGVEKLIKPVYGSDPARSGTNVKETETFDPDTGQWTRNPASADRTLPLFPRLHLLPNGHVFYNAAGQSFNPAGQSYDEAFWNIAASYDPAKQSWNELGVPGTPQTGTTTAPGFRGSASSTMLTLEPGADGSYTQARFLTAGGVLNPPSPGSYLPVAQSQIATVDTSKGDRLTTEETGPLKRPRWYGSQILLPTGEVAMFSGSDRDEVIAPGTEVPNREAELFDPRTKTWRSMALGVRSRTYHNTAALMPDGRVLIGGHAPISTLYGRNQTLPGGQFGPNEGRDPSFELFSPPYLHRGRRPQITGVRRGGSKANRISVALPRNADVLPPGPYMLFVNRKDGRGSAIPSVSRHVDVRAAGAGGAPTVAGGTVATHGDTLQVELAGSPDEIRDAVLVRYPTQTHLVDGDQRSVALPIVAREQGASLGLPSNKRCLSRRSFEIRLRAPRGDRLRSARVVVAGRAVKVRRRDGRLRARVDLRGRRRGTFTVRITARTAKGRRIVSRRTYRTCRPRRT